MEFDPLFDEFASDETGEDECPGCGAIPYVDGVTEGCHDMQGCGQFVRESADLSEDEMTEEEFEYEDDELVELDFDES